jgi:uncharacterized protein YjbJ (UPF0337 family)
LRNARGRGARDKSRRIAFPGQRLGTARRSHTARDKIMDKDRIHGGAKELKGKLKEAAGKLSGDKKLETEGKVDQAAGKAQGALGDLKDAARDALKDR